MQTMRATIVNSNTRMWLVLIVATLISGWIGEGERDRRASSVVLTIAFFKVWIVGIQFMELRSAPRLLRGIFSAWTVATCSALILILLE